MSISEVDHSAKNKAYQQIDSQDLPAIPSQKCQDHQGRPEDKNGIGAGDQNFYRIENECQNHVHSNAKRVAPRIPAVILAKRCQLDCVKYFGFAGIKTERFQ